MMDIKYLNPAEVADAALAIIRQVQLEKFQYQVHLTAATAAEDEAQIAELTKLIAGHEKRYDALIAEWGEIIDEHIAKFAAAMNGHQKLSEQDAQ
jgi:hypothetical protein